MLEGHHMANGVDLCVAYSAMSIGIYLTNSKASTRLESIHQIFVVELCDGFLWVQLFLISARTAALGYTTDARLPLH